MAANRNNEDLVSLWPSLVDRKANTDNNRSLDGAAVIIAETWDSSQLPQLAIVQRVLIALRRHWHRDR